MTNAQGAKSPKAPHTGRYTSSHVLQLAAGLVGLIAAFWLGKSSVGGSYPGASPYGRDGASWQGIPHTLTTYIFHNNSPEQLENLRFFVTFGIKPDDGSDYVILVQTGPAVKDVDLPALPPNARYVSRTTSCANLGLLGWLLYESGFVRLQDYRHFVVLDSSVRGPFLPTFLLPSVPWHRLLTDRLGSRVKLAGPVISCEDPAAGGTEKNGTQVAEPSNPYVLQFAMATDQAGLRVLRKDGDAMRCDARSTNEVAASRAILRAGYNLDSFMTRYQGIDWRDRRNWDCNARVDPLKEFLYDGITVHPYEVVFLHAKQDRFEARFHSGLLPSKYEKWKWQMAESAQSVSSNSGRTRVANRAKAKQALIDYMRVRGPICFDFGLYRKHNKDLRKLNNKQAWGHFVQRGQFEARFHRFICDDLASGPWQTPAAGNKTKHLGLCSCASTEFVPPAKWYLIP